MNRRDIIKALTLAALTNAELPAWAVRRGMYVSMRTQNGYWTAGIPAATVGVVPANDWEGLARAAARLGYGGVDFPLNPVMQAGPEKVKAVMGELKLKAGFLSGGLNPAMADEAAFKTAMNGFNDVCAFAAAFGCPRLMFRLNSSAAIPKDEWRKMALDRARAMSVIMDRHQVKMGIEFSGPMHYRTQFKYETIYRVRETLEFCKEAGPNWGLVLDSWHWYLAGGTYEDILAVGKSRIVAVHVSDAPKMAPEDVKDLVRLLPGEGVSPLTRFFAGLKKVGYEGHISPEPLGRFSADISADQAGRMTLAATLAEMKKAGIKPA